MCPATFVLFQRSSVPRSANKDKDRSGEEEVDSEISGDDDDHFLSTAVIDVAASPPVPSNMSSMGARQRPNWNKALFFEPKTESSRGKWLQFRASVWPERVIHQTKAKNDQYWAKISQIHTMSLIGPSV